MPTFKHLLYQVFLFQMNVLQVALFHKWCINRISLNSCDIKRVLDSHLSISNIVFLSNLVPVKHNTINFNNPRPHFLHKLILLFALLIKCLLNHYFFFSGQIKKGKEMSGQLESLEKISNSSITLINCSSNA